MAELHTTTFGQNVAVSLEGLRFIWLEITGKCNLTCQHCYAESGPSGTLEGDMSQSDWLRVIEEASELGCQEIQFIGGEPTLHPALPQLVAHARRHGFGFIEVFTNATGLSRGLIDCLKENSVRVASSFYSDDPSIHDQITNRGGSWRKTVDGFKSALAVGLDLRVGITEMQINSGQVPRTIEFLKGIGVKNIGTDRLRGVGRGELTRVGQHSGERFEELCGQCWKGKLCVTPSGETYPCVFARMTPLGNAKDGLREIVYGEKVLGFRSQVQMLDFERSQTAACYPDTCYPNMPCSPQTCNPQLPCSPQGPFCEPDRRCDPGACQPHNG